MLPVLTKQSACSTMRLYSSLQNGVLSTAVVCEALGLSQMKGQCCQQKLPGLMHSERFPCALQKGALSTAELG